MTATPGTTDLSGTPNPPQSHIGTYWIYFLLLAMQSAGATVVYWIGVPLYRRLLVDPSEPE
jgi:hypothetical protein